MNAIFAKAWAVVVFMGDDTITMKQGGALLPATRVVLHPYFWLYMGSASTAITSCHQCERFIPKAKRITLHCVQAIVTV